MNSIFYILCKSLDRDVRQLVQSNIESMRRSIKFLAEHKNDNLARAFDLGWDYQRLEILITIISFYQIVIGPVRSSSTLFTSQSWKRTNILYGSRLRFDSGTATVNQEMANKFEMIMSLLGVDFWILQTNNAEDLIYKIANPKENEPERH